MLAPIVVGAVTIEYFSTDGITPTATVRGTVSGFVTFLLNFQGGGVTDAFHLFYTFYQMALAAAQFEGHSEDIEALRQMTLSIETWLHDEENRLRSINAPQEDIQSVQTFQVNLANIKTKLNS